MLKPVAENGGWVVKNKNGTQLSSLTGGNFHGDVKYWPALLDAATQGQRRYVHNIDGWEEVDGSLITYHRYPFIKLFTRELHRRQGGWVIITECFTGKQIKCEGWKSVPNKRRNALALIKERGIRSFVEGIRKGIKAGISPTYEGINVKQYLDGWESTIIE